jgi:putative salt-induced outer membrane protein YdiY
MVPLIFLLCWLFVALPAYATPKPAFEHNSEAGVVITNGNSQAQSYSLKAFSAYQQEKNRYSAGGHYLRATSSGKESAENWMLSLRYERLIKDKLSAFLAQAVEGDEFAGILQRYNSDLGAKYYFYRSEKDFIWLGEAGYRFSAEHTTKGTHESFHKARIYTETEKYWRENISTKLWIEYIPNLTTSRAWLLNSEFSLSAALSDVFALKTSMLLRYNKTPPVATAQRADTTFTTALTAKY